MANPTPRSALGRRPTPPPGSPTEELALEWCGACHCWQPRPYGPCPSRRVPHETNGAVARSDSYVDAAPEPPREDRPCTILDASSDEAPSADAALHPRPIDVDASKGTANQLANLMGDDGNGFSPPGVSLPLDTLEEDAEPPAGRPPGDVGQLESRLAALIADTALGGGEPM